MYKTKAFCILTDVNNQSSYICVLKMKPVSLLIHAYLSTGRSQMPSARHQMKHNILFRFDFYIDDIAFWCIQNPIWTLKVRRSQCSMVSLQHFFLFITVAVLCKQPILLNTKKNVLFFKIQDSSSLWQKLRGRHAY